MKYYRILLLWTCSYLSMVSVQLSIMVALAGAAVWFTLVDLGMVNMNKKPDGDDCEDETK